MRACLETQKLEQLEARMDEIADRVARGMDREVQPAAGWRLPLSLARIGHADATAIDHVPALPAGNDSPAHRPFAGCLCAPGRVSERLALVALGLALRLSLLCRKGSFV